MENSVTIDAKISLFSFKNMKKQESFRYHMISAFVAMVQMVHVLHSLWDALLPFALLWWNVMLCATCAKYYSWNRSRFRLQIIGRQFQGAVMGEADAEEIREKSPLPSHQNEDVSHVDIMTSHLSGSHAQARCPQTVEVGSCCPQQSLPSAEDCILHGDELSTLDLYVDKFDTCAEDPHDHQFEEFSLGEEALAISTTQASKALDIASASPTRKLSSLHFFDIREAHQSGLLKAAYLAACPFLLPQQVAPLAVYDPSGRSLQLLEYLWMHSSVRMNRNLLKGKGLMQLHFNVFVNCSAVKECMHVMKVGFVSRISSTIEGKEYTCLKKQLVKLQENRACSWDYIILQVALLSLENVFYIRRITSSEALEETSKDVGSETGGHSSTFNLSNLESGSDSDYPFDGYDEDGSDVMGSFYGPSDQFYINHLVSSSDSSLDSNADVEAGDAVLASPLRADTMIVSGEDMGVFHENSIHLNDNYFDLHDGSDKGDARYPGLQGLQEIDTVYGEYYRAADGVFSDDTYFDDGLEAADAVCGDLRLVEENGVVSESSEANPLFPSADTWWDADAVLVGRPEHEEDSAEQAWQVV